MPDASHPVPASHLSPAADNLGRARVTVPAMLLEASGAGDLLHGGKGGPVHPVVLKARGRRGRDFVYVGGSKPRLTLRLRLTKSKKAYLFDLRARGGRLGKPRLCDSGRGRRPT